MQEKFRQTSGDSDDPPFNFQAMLRKTNKTRESLKRPEGSFPTSPSRNNNIVFMSPNIEKNNNIKVRVATPAPEKIETGGEKIELAPGLIIHGEVADL